MKEMDVAVQKMIDFYQITDHHQDSKKTGGGGGGGGGGGVAGDLKVVEEFFKFIGGFTTLFEV